MKLLQLELNSEKDELIADSQKPSALEHAQRVVMQLEADGWKWPKITLRKPPNEVGAVRTKPEAESLPARSQAEAGDEKLSSP